MKKYGLQLRVPPSQPKKQPTRPPLPPPLGFHDDDEDDVEREIARQATKNKALKDIEEQHKKALEEDPSVFDYDGVYDNMKAKVDRPRVQDREEKRPKYIQNLMKKAEERQREHEIVYERKLAKERSKDDHLYADKDKFLTSAYKKKLAEQAKWMEEERLRQLREEKEDVTKKTDLSDFYFNLGKNVAYGAKDVESRKAERQAELRKTQKPEEKRLDSLDNMPNEGRSFTDSNSTLDSSTGQKREASPLPRRTESLDAKPTSEKLDTETLSEGKSSAEQSGTDQPKRDHHKRNDDALAAAKERFLARKRAKEQ